MVGDAEFGHGGGQLPDAVGAEGVVAVGCQVGEPGRDDLALLTEGAGHQRDVGTLGRVLGHGDAVVDRLVVRVRVHEEQTTGGKTVHGAKPTIKQRGERRAAYSLRPLIMLATLVVSWLRVGAMVELAR